jgi:DNA (cytosine-5)-methyltransferase 1
MKHLDLFSGIGGFALAVEEVWPEVEHVFCDIEPFSQAILKKHWPNSQIYGDIKKLKPEAADLVTGGFPCQPFSAAGKRKGTKDDRHLWPEMLRVIRESTPRWVVGENVSGLLTWDGGVVLDQVYADLEAEGYEVWSFVIPAVAVNAPHRRDRVWIVAKNTNDHGRIKRELEKQGGVGDEWDTSTGDGEWVHSKSNTTDTNSNGLQKQGPKQQTGGDRQLNENTTNPTNSGLERSPRSGIQGREQSPHLPSRGEWDKNWIEVATELCVMDDGLPNGLARPRGWRNAALKGAGNAIVPQVAVEIFKAIKEIDKDL